MRPANSERYSKTGLIIAVAFILPPAYPSSTFGLAEGAQETAQETAVAVEAQAAPSEELDSLPPPSRPDFEDRKASACLVVPLALPRAFTLDVQLGREPRFRLFSERDPRPAEMPSLPPRSPGPVLGASLTASLTFMTDQTGVPEGLQMSFRPLTWDDLDAWEKAGLVVSYTSAVVGAAYLFYSLFD